MSDNTKVNTKEKMVWLLGLEQNMEQIMEVLQNAYGLKKEGSGNKFSLARNDLEVNVEVYTSEMSAEVKNYVEEQRKAIWGHFFWVETENTDIKNNLFYQLIKTNFIAVIHYHCEEKEKNQDGMVLNPLIEVLPILKGVMIIDGGGAALGEEGKLILSKQGASQLKYFMPYENTIPQNLPDTENSESMKRQERSMELIHKSHIYVPGGLPLIESEEQVNIRSVEEVAGRAAALLMVSLYSECLLGENMEVKEAREFVQSVAERFGADKYFSPKEKAYLENPYSTEQERIHYSWQYEDLFVMEWALGLIEELPFPDIICDVPLTVSVLNDFASMEEMLQNVKMRTASELLDALDLIFRLDWACVDARVYNLAAPAGMEGGITMERHKCLNWLTGFGESVPWDEVDTPT